MTNTYILSTEHAGSTLLDMILGSHPDAVSGGEVVMMPKSMAMNRTCSCGVPVRACEFWKNVFEDVGARLCLDVERNPYELDLGFINATRNFDPHHQTARYRLFWRSYHATLYALIQSGFSPSTTATRRMDLAIDNTIAFYDAMRRVSGRDTVIDSSKGYLKGIMMLERHPASTRLIFLHRDGRAVLDSIMRRGGTRDYGIRAWKTVNQRALNLLDRLSLIGKTLFVGYEELTSSPQSTLEKICEYIGLPFSPDMLRFGEAPRHIAEGNDMRMQKTSEIRTGESWSSRLTADDIKAFELRAGALNRRLGYVPSRS